MKLDYTKYGQGDPILILHGLFGSSDNWATLGKKIASHYSVFLVDQRNHGRSPHSNEMDYDAMAGDIIDLMNDQSLKKAILLGHSMGGKTVMRFAQKFPEKVEKLIVADMGVKGYPPHHDIIFDALNALDIFNLTSRSDADEQMKMYIKDRGVRQFLLKNLYRTERETFAWRMNVKVLQQKIDNILAPIPDEMCMVPALFIRGLASNYITDADKKDILRIFPNATFADMQAGHWLHAEDPEVFLEITMDFVTKK